MSTASSVLEELVTLSRWLGNPAYDYAILGEGNTSAAPDEVMFYVKASGVSLSDIDGSGFVAVRRASVLKMLDTPDLDDAAVLQGLMESRIDPFGSIRPSVETLLHAYLLTLPGIRFIGHSHPTPVNAILCSRQAEEAVAGRLFPDEIVCCGPAPCWVPYTDPGHPLARRLRVEVERYMQNHAVPPRIILMQNHGLIALGRTPAEVQTATAMAVKTARILLGTAAFGGPNFLTEENVRRIYTRPDEKYREEQIGSRK